jgi:hypothetical protein
MLSRREVVVVNPEPVMTRSGNPELRLNATKLGRCDEAPGARKEHTCTGQNVTDESASRRLGGSSKAVVAWTQIPEIWAALERRFA